MYLGRPRRVLSLRCLLGRVLHGSGSIGDPGFMNPTRCFKAVLKEIEIGDRIHSSFNQKNLQLFYCIYLTKSFSTAQLNQTNPKAVVSIGKVNWRQSMMHLEPVARGVRIFAITRDGLKW